MSYGIRIRHNKARGGLFPVPLLHRPLLDGKQPVCGACFRATGSEIRHAAKTVHLVLEADGTAIVSRAIWDDFRRCQNNAGFVPANLVIDPPSQSFTPPTEKVELDGIQFGVKKAPRMVSTGSGRLVRAQDQPDVMDLDGYVDKCAELGVGKDKAINALLEAALHSMNGGASNGS